MCVFFLPFSSILLRQKNLIIKYIKWQRPQWIDMQSQQSNENIWIRAIQRWIKSKMMNRNFKDVDSENTKSPFSSHNEFLTFAIFRFNCDEEISASIHRDRTSQEFPNRLCVSKNSFALSINVHVRRQWFPSNVCFDLRLQKIVKASAYNQDTSHPDQPV